MIDSGFFVSGLFLSGKMGVMPLSLWYGGWMCRKRRGVGVFLVHLFHRQTSQRITAHTSQSTRPRPTRKEKENRTGADCSWIRCVALSAVHFICSSLPFQRAALCYFLTVQSSSALWGSPWPELSWLQATSPGSVCVCVCVCVWVCERERERWGYAQN